MTYLLDSNVVSELWKPKPDENVLEWLASSEWLVPVVVIAEIQEGAEAAPSKARSMEINARLDAFIEECSELVLEWDTETARTWGRLAHTRAVKRQPQSLWDSLIDAMAVRHGAKIDSRNGNDFRHAIIYNPWTGLEHLPG